MSTLALITQSVLTQIANSIRSKLGTSDTYLPSEMPAAIDSISGGTTGPKTITANGVYDAQDDSYDGYSVVTVNVSVCAITKTLTHCTVNINDHIAAGTYTITATADSGYQFDTAPTLVVGATTHTFTIAADNLTATLSNVSITEDSTLTATAEAEPLRYTEVLRGCTSDYSGSTVTEGDTVTITLTADKDSGGTVQLFSFSNAPTYENGAQSGTFTIAQDGITATATFTVAGNVKVKGFAAYLLNTANFLLNEIAIEDMNNTIFGKVDWGTALAEKEMFHIPYVVGSSSRFTKRNSYYDSTNVAYKITTGTQSSVYQIANGIHPVLPIFTSIGNPTDADDYSFTWYFVGSVPLKYSAQYGMLILHDLTLGLKFGVLPSGYLSFETSDESFYSEIDASDYFVAAIRAIPYDPILYPEEPSGEHFILYINGVRQTYITIPYGSGNVISDPVIGFENADFAYGSNYTDNIDTFTKSTINRISGVVSTKYMAYTDGDDGETQVLANMATLMSHYGIS